ncbi:PilW family protein [Lutispora thermophila]|uniref:Prepilin-type N-terminal cleavage/methylation domain-containing protein n=1 Tax=Lutispora thermophila DSM 19022 TaxID=1122184 RepID=A0A1M6F411_9FIRM|nr:type II secretion system protein [Lutispora thermophila]SHI92447.1 prepilin-type N-terminal cleavage/methylation domain-containing protein [Lutispora thermophila DSM 19022]
MIGNWKGSKKGFTIIELLITMPIFGIIILLVFTATISNMNTIKHIEAEVELQQQAQLIFSFMEEKIIQSSGVIFLQDSKGFQKHNTNEKLSILKIIFKNPPNHKDKGYIFALSKDSENDYYNLKYGIGTWGGASNELGNYIRKIEVEPIPKNKKYNEADGINIKIYFSLEGYTLAYENSYFFRNSSRRV